MSNVHITGKVAIGLCDWIYDESVKGNWNRSKLNKLLNLALKYNTNNVKDEKRWSYNPCRQSITFYHGLYSEKAVDFKRQIVS